MNQVARTDPCHDTDTPAEVGESRQCTQRDVRATLFGLVDAVDHVADVPSGGRPHRVRTEVLGSHADAQQSRDQRAGRRSGDGTWTLDVHAVELEREQHSGVARHTGSTAGTEHQRHRAPTTPSCASRVRQANRGAVGVRSVHRIAVPGSQEDHTTAS
jgi:hypothetical protein